MRDVEREKIPQHRPDPPVRAQVEAPRPATLERSPALDTPSVLHLQRVAGNQGVVQMLAGEEESSPVHDVVGSGAGMPLDASTRSTMESAFGTSFDDVRVHTDDRASRSAESVGANAYTVGSDVVFRSGQYDPGSGDGQRRLAHELAHVVQQSEGPVDGTPARGGIRVSDPSDRFEQAAERQADRAVAAMGAGPGPASTAPGGGESLQREEDEAVAHVQREAVPEEDEEPGEA